MVSWMYYPNQLLFHIVCESTNFSCIILPTIQSWISTNPKPQILLVYLWSSHYYTFLGRSIDPKHHVFPYNWH